MGEVVIMSKWVVVSPNRIAATVEREFGTKPDHVTVESADAGAHVEMFFVEYLYDEDAIHRKSEFGERLREYSKPLCNAVLDYEEWDADTSRQWTLKYDILFGNPRGDVKTEERSPCGACNEQSAEVRVSIRKEWKQGTTCKYIAVMIDTDTDSIPESVEYEGILIERSKCHMSTTIVDGTTVTDVYPPWAHICGKCNAGWWCEIGADGKQILRCMIGRKRQIVDPRALCIHKPDCWLPHFIHGC